MSFSGEPARSLLAPLVGRTTTFLLESRRANLDFARVVTGLIKESGNTCAIFDLDAFYSSNSDLIFGSANSPAAGTSILVPEPGADLEVEFSKLIEIDQRALVIDSLNTLYHLISGDDESSRSRRLAFAMASLSYYSRANGKTVLVSMYRREAPSRRGTRRSISSLTEGTAAVDVGGQEMILRSERGVGWPGGRLSIRIPSG